MLNTGSTPKDTSAHMHRLVVIFNSKMTTARSYADGDKIRSVYTLHEELERLAGTCVNARAVGGPVLRVHDSQAHCASPLRPPKTCTPSLPVARPTSTPPTPHKLQKQLRCFLSAHSPVRCMRAHTRPPLGPDSYAHHAWQGRHDIVTGQASRGHAHCIGYHRKCCKCVFPYTQHNPYHD